MSTADRRAREKAQRRQEILDAARQEFLERGVHRPTVDDIAGRAEVSKGTIYLYFKSKEEILAHLLLEGLNQLLADLRAVVATDPTPLPAAALRSLATAYLRFCQENPLYFRLLLAFDRGRFEEAIPRRLHQRVLNQSLCGLRLVAEVIEAGSGAGVFQVRDAWKAAGAVWAALNGVLVLMAHPLRKRMLRSDVDGMLEATFELVLRGLVNGPLPRVP